MAMWPILITGVQGSYLSTTMRFEPLPPRSMRFAILPLLIAGPLVAQGLTLGTFVETVLRNQPRLAEDSLGIVRAKNQVDRLYKEAILPKFELSAAFGPAPGFRYITEESATAQGSFDTTGREYEWWPLGPYFGTELEIAQPLNADRFRSGMKAARAGVRVAKARFEVRRQDEAREALTYWFGFQYANRMVSLLESARTRIDSVQGVLQKKLDDEEEGANLDDLLNLKIGRLTLEKGLVEARLGRERARAAMVFFMGSKPGTPVVLKDSLLSPLPELPGLDTLLLRFQHPDLAQLEAGLAATKAMVEVERGALGPDIFIFAKFQYTKAWVANRDEKNRDVLVTDPINSVSGAFGLGVRWRLNYWSQQTAVRRAELDWRALKRKETYARDGLELYLKDSWMRYRALGDKITEVQKAIEACEALLESVVAAMDLDPDRAKDLVGPYKSWVDLKSQYYDLLHQRSLVTLEVLRNAGLVTRTEYLTRP